MYKKYVCVYLCIDCVYCVHIPQVTRKISCISCCLLYTHTHTKVTPILLFMLSFWVTTLRYHKVYAVICFDNIIYIIHSSIYSLTLCMRQFPYFVVVGVVRLQSVMLYLCTYVVFMYWNIEFNLLTQLNVNAKFWINFVY